MTRDELYLARVLFANKLLKSNGSAFQTLFWSVKRARHGQEFVAVSPQGPLGDGGSDGYLPADGHYFQLYGPVDPSDKAQRASEKLSADLAKILKKWNDTTPIRMYSFVYNDKYEGVFTQIAMALAVLGSEHPKITCRPYTAGNLEDEFMRLAEAEMIGIIGLIPDPQKIGAVDYSVLKEVIANILATPAGQVTTRFGELPELSKKIELNHLGGPWGEIISQGARRAGHVDKYFARNSTFAKQSLRDHMVKVYQGVRDRYREQTAIASGMSREDLIFADFRQGLLSPDATVATEAAVDILIGYYFETCDIFVPFAAKDAPNASA